MYDVVIQDGVGAPYAGNTVSGIGGSEHFVIKLALALVSSGLRVLVRNNMQAPAMKFEGVEYESHFIPRYIECKTLLLQRSTPLPTNIDFDHLMVQAHDMPGEEHNSISKFIVRLGGTLICSSSWQRSLFPDTWKSHIIPPMFHHLDTPTRKDPTSFIYASAALKGFDETLTKWLAFKKLYYETLKDARLYVISSGYDVPKYIQDPSVIYLGTLNDQELRTYLGMCVGLFYVNVFPETFGATAAIAEVMGTRTHILCLNGFGALEETLSDHRFLTADPDKFQRSFLECYGSEERAISTKDYRYETTLLKWRQALKV